MATLQARVAYHIGLTPNATRLNVFLEDEARWLAHRVRADLAAKNATIEALSDAPTTFDATNVRIVAVYREGRRCLPYDGTDQSRLTDSGGLHYATTETPRWYYLASPTVPGTIKVAPVTSITEDAYVHYIKYDYTIDCTSDSSLTDFPIEAEQALILGSAIRYYNTLVADKRAQFPSLTVAAPDLSALSAPTFNLTLTDYNTHFDENDVELAQTELAKLSRQLEEYSADISAYSAEVQKELGEYRSQYELQLQGFASNVQKINAELAVMQAELGSMMALYEKELELIVERPQAA